MTRRTIRLITIVMGLSMIGLVIFQLYWIQNALDINKARFKQDVHQVLNDVVDKLEKQEALFTISNSFETSFDLATLDSLSFDTLTLDRIPEIKVYKGKDTATQTSSNLSVSVEQDGFRLDLDQENTLRAKSLGDEQKLALEIQEIQKAADSIKEKSKLEHKSEMVTIILDELLTGKRKMNNRLQPQQLDSLLQVGLSNQGIDIPYNFGVQAHSADSLMFANNMEQQGSLLKSDLRVTLFPNDIIGDSHFLLVHFPTQRQYLINKIWIPLILAALLIVLVIACFGYAIFTILRQKKLSTMKNDFINNMTHEFKTPISTISLATEALQDQSISTSPGTLTRYLNIIEVENQRLSRQVEKVLQIASLEKEDFKLKIEEVDVHRTIEKALENIVLQVEKKGGQITTDFRATDKVIPADEHHLTNIIYNLLDNANKYSDKPPEINITTENELGKGICIRVIDNGIGMTKEVLSRIFDKFYRKPTGNLHDVKGFGLGLAYVKALIEAHGGNINVKSSSGKGSIFEIFLPN